MGQPVILSWILKTWCGGMLIRTVDRFSMSLVQVHLTARGHSKSNFKVPVQRPNHLGSPPSCRETLMISSNFLLARLDQRVSSKNGGTSTKKPIAEAIFDDLHWKTPTRRFKEFSSAANRCTPTIFWYSVLCLCCKFRLQPITIHGNRRCV